MNTKTKKTIAVGSIATAQAVTTVLTGFATKCIGQAVVKTLELTPAGRVAFAAGNVLLGTGCEIGINAKFENWKEGMKGHFSKKEESEEDIQEETVELTVIATEE